MLTLIRLVAEAAPVASVQTYLLTQGVLGVATLVLGLAFWRAWSRECARADRAEAALAALNHEVQTQVIPALVRSTEQLERTVALLPEVSAALAARSRRS